MRDNKNYFSNFFLYGTHVELPKLFTIFDNAGTAAQMTFLHLNMAVSEKLGMLSILLKPQNEA